MIVDRRLNEIREEVIKLHGIAKRSVELCLDGLKGNDEVRRKLEELEKEADAVNFDVDYSCVTFIALFQPVARDLRFAISMMKISSAYERITDLALEIGYYYCRDELLIEIFEGMKSKLIEMFGVIENSYSGKDVDLVYMLRSLDNVIDDYYDRALSHLKKKCDVETVLVARHLERIGDLLGKIGAGIVFIEEGRRIWIK